MRNTEAIENFLELVLWSGWVENTKPLSVLIISEVGAGKTTLLKKFKENNGVVYLNDATAYGISRELLPRLQRDQINHILLADLLTPFSKNRTTVNSFVTFLNGLLEEGIVEIQTYAVQWRGEEIRCGLITTIPRNDLVNRRHGWGNLGFMSRMLPLSWTYSEETVMKIYDDISEGIKDEELINISFPEKKKFIEENPYINKSLIPLSMYFAEAESIYGFRMQKQLQTLLMSSAIKDGRGRVTSRDYDTVLDLIPYMSVTSPAEL